MTAWVCDKCGIVYREWVERCEEVWCGGGEVREVEVSYDAEGLVIVAKEGSE